MHLAEEERKAATDKLTLHLSLRHTRAAPSHIIWGKQGTAGCRASAVYMFLLAASTFHPGPQFQSFDPQRHSSSPSTACSM